MNFAMNVKEAKKIIREKGIKIEDIERMIERGNGADEIIQELEKEYEYMTFKDDEELIEAIKAFIQNHKKKTKKKEEKNRNKNENEVEKAKAIIRQKINMNIEENAYIKLALKPLFEKLLEMKDYQEIIKEIDKFIEDKVIWYLEKEFEYMVFRYDKEFKEAVRTIIYDEFLNFYASILTAFTDF